MKVGVYLGDFTPENGGGYTFQDEVFTALLDLAAESQHKFRLIYRGEIAPDIYERLRRAGIEPAPLIANRAANSKWVQSAQWVKRIARRFIKPTDLYNQALKNAGLDFIWFVSGTAVPLDIPYLCTIWDLQHRRQPWFPEVSEQGMWNNREKLHRELLQRATYIITGAEAGKDEIIRFYGVMPDRVRLLPHPTPSFALRAPSSPNPDLLVSYRLPEKFLFYPAQFWAHKNHAGILHALAQLRQTYNLSVPVVFVGSDKGNQAYLESLADRLQVREQVYILGFIPREVLVELYRQALALVYMTFFGPENLPPLEAFALGCPVIASSVAGAEEQLGDAALLVDPIEHQALADAIKTIYENPQLRSRLIERGHARAARWTASDYVRGVFRLLDEFEPIRSSWGA